MAAVVVTAAGATYPSGSYAHAGNPDYRSRVTGWSQEYGGVFAHVARYDDSLVLLNRSGTPLTVRGYRGEPYLRFGHDNVVRVNRNAPTTYLNEDRYGQGVSLPAGVTPRAQPLWETVSRNGRYSWHDHRIHWMSRSLPPQVKDPEQRTEVFRWRVPVEYGPQRTTIEGVLLWVGEPGAGGDDGSPLPLVLGLGAALLGGLGLVAAMRRRRRGATAGSDAW